jgi:hypothetical protein
MATERGRGELFLVDGRSWGLVDYELRIPPSSGHLTPAVPVACLPGAAFLDVDGSGRLLLEDGRWWLCLVQPDGSARAASPTGPNGFHSSRPA